MHRQTQAVGLDREEARVPVAGEEHHLEKHDTCVPDHRATTRTWEHHSCDHRLYQKHEPGTGEDRERKQQHEKGL